MVQSHTSCSRPPGAFDPQDNSRRIAWGLAHFSHLRGRRSAPPWDRPHIIHSGWVSAPNSGQNLGAATRFRTRNPEIPPFANPRGYRTGFLSKRAKFQVLLLVLTDVIQPNLNAYCVIIYFNCFTNFLNYIFMSIFYFIFGGSRQMQHIVGANRTPTQMLTPATRVLLFSIIYEKSIEFDHPRTTGATRYFKSTCNTFLLKSVNHTYGLITVLHLPGTGAYRYHVRDKADTSLNPMVHIICRIGSTNGRAVSIDMVRGVSWPCSQRLCPISTLFAWQGDQGRCSASGGHGGGLGNPWFASAIYCLVVTRMILESDRNHHTPEMNPHSPCEVLRRPRPGDGRVCLQGGDIRQHRHKDGVRIHVRTKDTPIGRHPWDWKPNRTVLCERETVRGGLGQPAGFSPGHLALAQLGCYWDGLRPIRSANGLGMVPCELPSV